MIDLVEPPVDHGAHTVSIWHYDATAATKATIVRTAVDINGTLDPSHCPAASAGFVGGGGPATIGDFNADHFPDVALAGGVGYAVLDGSKIMNAAIASTDPSLFLFLKQTQDCSSAATGSSLFDFNGDGNVEVAYADELHLHVYDGKTGTAAAQSLVMLAFMVPLLGLYWIGARGQSRAPLAGSRSTAV